jgi:hypothetical protein
MTQLVLSSSYQAGTEVSLAKKDSFKPYRNTRLAKVAKVANNFYKTGALEEKL